MAESPIVLQTETFRYEIGRDGQNRAFVDLGTGRDYLEPGQPCMSVGRGETVWPASRVQAEADVLSVSFGEAGVQVQVRVETRARYLTLALDKVSGAAVDWVQFCQLRLRITENVGPLVNAAWSDRFAAAVLACNDRTDSYGGDAKTAYLCARGHRPFGLEGAKVAVLARHTGGPDPAARLLDAIQEVELEQGLPHPLLHGTWIKRAPERFASYLMAHDVGEHNIDEVLELAKGGFGCIEIYPWQSTPSYTLNPKLFPNGLAGLKTVADKIHAAGMQLGLHVMQGMVGWGGMHDPYVTPQADPRLLQDRRATLAAAVGPESAELKLKESVADWPDSGDALLAGEIVRYTRRTEDGLAGCQRGMHGTTVRAHAAGTPVGHLVNCFNMWGNCIYSPDVSSTMLDEICQRIATLFNETDCDMAYFDGGEEVAVQPPHWRNQGRIALGVMQRLKKPVILEGNALYTHLSWHVITRGSPSYDPMYFGRREYTLRFKGQNPAGWAKNLLTGDVGWFAPHAHALATDAVTPDEVMLLCLKALGGQAPISFSVSAANLSANQRLPEMLEIIRACDELKRRDYFPEEVRAELARPMAEHVLEPVGEGEWVVRPWQLGPTRLVKAAPSAPSGAGNHAWTCANPYGQQKPWLRLRARTRLAPYGAQGNLVLADYGNAIPFRADGTASTELTQAVEPTPEKTPDGANAFCYRARNQGTTRSGWARLSLPFPEPVDLSAHRRVGVWVRADGQGGILNVQLANKYGYRDHYVPLDFTGWSYFELDPPETGRFYDYAWPYSFVDMFYWPFRYQEIVGLNLYFNDLPPGVEATCLIGRIEALQEQPVPLQNPALEANGCRVAFPVSLQPDAYLEWDGTGPVRHFGPNGEPMGSVQPEGSLLLQRGENHLLFSCAAGDRSAARAEITLAVKGEPLTGRRSDARQGAAAP